MGAGQRLGICGRTGSGKSSLVRCLMRMMSVDGGQVLVDGVDVRRVPVALVRRAVTVVSQDPLLFSGTVRFNLDPTGQASDEQLHAALRCAGLMGGQDGGVRSGAGGAVSDAHRGSGRSCQLSDAVEDGGSNWSQGEKQLLALARALVWRQQTRLVVIDEGTSSVDEQADRAIQRVLA